MGNSTRMNRDKGISVTSGSSDAEGNIETEEQLKQLKSQLHTLDCKLPFFKKKKKKNQQETCIATSPF